LPTTTAFNCRPFRNGNSEACEFNNPNSGTWFIGVYGFAGYTGLNLSVEVD